MQIATHYPCALATSIAAAPHGESASDFDRFLTAQIKGEYAERETTRNRQENDEATERATERATLVSRADSHLLPDHGRPAGPAPIPPQTPQDTPASAPSSDDCERNQTAAGLRRAAAATAIPAEISVMPPVQAGADLQVGQPIHPVAAVSPPLCGLHGLDAMTNAAGHAAMAAAPASDLGKASRMASATEGAPEVSILSGPDSQMGPEHNETGKGATQNGSAYQSVRSQPTTVQAGEVVQHQNNLSAVTITMRPADSSSAPSPASIMAQGAGPVADQPRTAVMLPDGGDQEPGLGNLAFQRRQPSDLPAQQDQGLPPGQEQAAKTDPLSPMLHGARSISPAEETNFSRHHGAARIAPTPFGSIAGGHEGAQPPRPGADLLIPPAETDDGSMAPGPIAGLLATIPTPGAGLASAAGQSSAQTPIQQVSQMMVQVARNGPDGPIDIALHPEELGQIRFELTTTGNRLHITLFVERPESLDLFRRHINDLMTDIRQSGFGQTSLSFGNWSQREHQPAPPVPEGQAALRPTQTQQGWSDTDRGPAQTYDTGRLDLRL